MGDLQHGHLKTGFGRCSSSFILTYKIIKTKLKKTHKIVLTIINKSTAKLRAYL